MAVKPIPDGYHAITPYLIVKGAAQAIEFYKKAFGAVELMRFDMPGGLIGHAEMKFGDSMVMLADEHPQMGAVGPLTVGGTPVGLCFYVTDVDSVAEKAIAAGAAVERPVQDQFYGDRTGTFRDPFGHKWTVATHKEDVSHEEMQRR
jgi:PhnB protein